MQDLPNKQNTGTTESDNQTPTETTTTQANRPLIWKIVPILLTVFGAFNIFEGGVTLILNENLNGDLRNALTIWSDLLIVLSIPWQAVILCAVGVSMIIVASGWWMLKKWSYWCVIWGTGCFAFSIVAKFILLLVQRQLPKDAWTLLFSAVGYFVTSYWLTRPPYLQLYKISSQQQPASEGHS